MGRTVRLIAADGHELAAYRADPDGPARGGLVVLQEVFGVNGHIRALTDGFAAEGFASIAPALFDRLQPEVELGYEAPDIEQGRALMLKADRKLALLDVQAAVDAVSSAGKVGIVGYCWGGLMAWLAAAHLERIACCVPYYGAGITDATHEQPRVPVMLHFGESDQHIPMEAVDRFRAALPNLPVYVYPCGHGFNCEQRASYDPDCALLARERTLEFLRTWVSAAQSAPPGD